jgi:tetratricopeptide (TPR) repeat protein
VDIYGAKPRKVTVPKNVTSPADRAYQALMEHTAVTPARAWTLEGRLRALRARIDAPAIAAWTLAFALVAYLALRNGGYDTVVRSEVGVAVWWFVLLAALAGILPRRVGTAGWLAIALLAAFACWTGLAIGWSQSAERSAVELGRLAAYLGVLVLAIALQGQTAARHTINGVACAIGLVALLAVLSRLHPQAFPTNDHLQFLGLSSVRRLSYPLNYWNALAAIVALGAPLLLAVALGARTLAARAGAAAALPVCALCVDLTISRGGALALAIGLGAFLLLTPRRLSAVATLLVAGAGSAILISAASERGALLSGVPGKAAAAQGTAMLWLLVVVCGGVALLQVAIGLAGRELQTPAWLAPTRRAFTFRGLAALVVAVAVAVAAGAPGAIADRWRQFEAPLGTVVPTSETSLLSRLQVANGNARYELWRSALNANATDPWKGNGPGTFEFWWSQHGNTPGFVRNAHSLYLETLAETGIIGLVLLGGLLLWLLGVAVVRSLGAPPHLRLWIAAAAAGLLAFMTAAALEWVWQMAAIAAAVMALGAVIVAGREDAPAAPARARQVALTPRVVLSVLAVVALAAVLIPLAGTVAIRDSRAAAAAGNLKTALADSRTAERLQPYAATPHLQRALVLEAQGDLVGAAGAARIATDKEPTNWRTWLVRARLDARRGATNAALGELRRARALNPRSVLFTPQ